MGLPTQWLEFLSLLALFLFPWLGAASNVCECGGFSTEIDGGRYIFTELIETDFSRLSNLTNNYDWMRVEFTKRGESARGPFGERFLKDNVQIVTTNAEEPGPKTSGETGDDPGLHLVVRKMSSRDEADRLVRTAELDSARGDVGWGSFRVSMKAPSVQGTCAAAFWYHNDTQELDMEFLTKEFDKEKKEYPLNLVVHSFQSSQKDYDATEAGTFLKANLPFDPTAAFHEYRIDYLPNLVVFYADGQIVGRVNGSAVPTAGGHLILQHWSSGNPLWSGGPPKEDTVFQVKYVKAYFNSSSGEVADGAAARGCSGDEIRRAAPCPIPDGQEEFFVDQDAAPGGRRSDSDGNTRGDRAENSKGRVHVSRNVLAGAVALAFQGILYY